MAEEEVEAEVEGHEVEAVQGREVEGWEVEGHEVEAVQGREAVRGPEVEGREV